MKYKFEGELTIENIRDFIRQHELEDKPRLTKLSDYYLGNHEILRKKYEDGKPDARMVHNFASYITNQATSYFMGVPVSYTSRNDMALELIQRILDYNDEADTNATHAENMSIYGKSYEVLYIDKSSRVDTRFTVINPKEMIVLYDYSLEPNITAAIRYYYDKNKKLFVELYEKNTITYLEEEEGNFKIVNSLDHFFGEVPVVAYINNNNLQGDFEPVLGLIDQYNEVNSYTSNDFAYFSDAYLFLSGASIDEEEARNMKENKLINVDDPNAKAQFLTKNINDTALENYKKRLENDIHKFSSVPSLSDESFASNLSGVAIKYKIIGLESQAAMKERKFKKGLQRRFELLYNLLYTRGFISKGEYLDVNPIFSRNLPVNLADEADIAVKLVDIVSKETILNQLSIVEDAAVELEQIAQEGLSTPKVEE